MENKTEKDEMNSCIQCPYFRNRVARKDCYGLDIYYTIPHCKKACRDLSDGYLDYMSSGVEESYIHRPPDWCPLKPSDTIQRPPLQNWKPILSEFDKVCSVLGSPFFETEDCAIYNCDCVEAMQLLNQDSGAFIDLCVTSPPYNIGKEYESLRTTEDYLSWCQGWVQLIYSLTRRSGAFWLNLGYFELPTRARAIPIPYLMWDRIPFYLIQEIVWNYGAGVASKKNFSPRNEKFLWYVRDQDNYVFNLDSVRDKNVKYPSQKKNGKLRCNPLGKNPTDVWQIPKVTSGARRSSKERTPHPAQFPLQVIERIILATSNAGDLVFDPFLGSGTTVIAALNTGRRAVGFETNTLYCDIARDRVIKFLGQRK